MGTSHLKMLRLLLVVTVLKICAAQNDMTLSVYTVTSKSMTTQWTPISGVSFYRLKATPKNSLQGQVFVQFGQNTIIGSIISLTPDTHYTVQVEAMDDQMTVIASADTDALTAPDIPTITSTSSKTSESITVQFPEVPGATGYILRAVSKTGDFFLETPVSSSPGTVQGLLPYTMYEISIMSVNAGGRSQPSYSVDQRTVIVAPYLSISSPNSTSIELTWEPVDHAIEYTFLIIPDTSNDRIEKSTNETELVLHDLQPGTIYTITVHAVDDEGRPGDDQTFSQITRPSSPEMPAIQIDGQSRIFAFVFWKPVNGAAGYTVTTSNGQTCTSTLYSYCNLVPVQCSQNQTVTVSAYNSAGSSDESDAAPYLTYPCPPNNTRIEEDSPGNCSVKWDEVKMVDFYMIYVKGLRKSGHEIICNTTDTRCQFNCTCGHTFTAIVNPYNKVGGSPLVQLVNYTTVPCCPDNINVTLISTETVDIEWSEASGADLFQVTAAETDDIIHCNDTEPMCALSGLECGTEYSIKVTPCSEISGCNTTCPAHTQMTAPCPPEVNILLVNSNTYRVQVSKSKIPNTTHIITAKTSDGGVVVTCEMATDEDFCDLEDLPCGTVFKVTGVAVDEADDETSLPSYEKRLETAPCCPDTNSVAVVQKTQSMTFVSWDHAEGAGSYITTLTSQHGKAKCHTEDNECLMGCITCGTNYTVSIQAISSTGHQSECSYAGFSSSPCCPTHIKLYRVPKNGTMGLRVSWSKHQSASSHKHSAELWGHQTPLSCVAPPGQKFCDVVEQLCEMDYTVLVAPELNDGTKVSFCQNRTLSAPCHGSNSVIV